MSRLITPEGYRPLLDIGHTEQGIKRIKDFFQQNLATELRLRRVTAPLFVLKGLGINDDLNGVERPVSFPIKDMGDRTAEVVHSLAKWKRLSLAKYGIKPGFGIYADMNAIRADEELDNLHSLYVDQWDWEAVITKEERTVSFLKDVVRRIYSAILRTEFLVSETYDGIEPFLPREITFIHTEDLLRMYPDKTPKEREDLITKKYGAVFLIGIGGRLPNGEKHDGRAPDYDDWSTVSEEESPGSTATSSSGTRCSDAPSSSPPWASALTANLSSGSLSLRVRRKGSSCISTGSYLRAACRSASAEASVRAASAWSFSTRPTSARSRPASGRRRWLRSAGRQE